MSEMTIQQAMDLAIQHHQAGRLRDAATIYQQILAADASQPDALHLLGVVAFQSGQFAPAIELIGRAISIEPGQADFHCNLGQALVSAGRFDEAVAAYHRAIELDPKSPDAHNSLGNTLLARGDIDAAIQSIRRALALRPNFAEAHNNLGSALLAAKRTDDAILEYQTAIAQKPGLIDAWNNFANASKSTGRVDEAIGAYRRVVSARPNAWEAWNNLGSALEEKSLHEDAITSYRRAVSARPDYPEALNNLGNALAFDGKFDEAIRTFHEAIKSRSDFPDAHVNLGVALLESGRPELAVAEFRKAVALKPGLTKAHVNLGISMLLLGDFRHGWAEYEWRSHDQASGYPHDASAKPRWDGSDLNGRRILLESEQGLGDAIQFIRYLPMVAARGGKVLVACRNELVRLLGSMTADAEFIPRGQQPPDFDVHLPLMSLAHIFQTDIASIPAGVPYLHADPKSSDQWRQRLGKLDGLKIGLVWAGRAEHRNDRYRSISLNALAPLARIEGTRLISLQKSPDAPATTENSTPFPLIDWTAELNDFADTAALVANLDLVITIDSAVAHLAGAMGKPVWVLLPFVPDWRWMLKRDDSPWYPTMRLFRQPALGDWSTVIQRVAAELKSKKKTPPL